MAGKVGRCQGKLESLTMKFKQQGQLVKIQGDPKLLRTKVSLQSICKHIDVELAMFL